AVVLVDRRRHVPAEVERALEPTAAIELHEVTAEAVVTRERAVEHPAVWERGGRAGADIADLAGRGQVGGGVDAQGRSRAAVEEPRPVGNLDAAAVVEVVAQRRRPLEA